MDRLVAAGNSGLAGVIEAGAVDATDPLVAVFTLAGPNGNFPYLVSCFNAQTPITPVAYETGTTLDASPNGTGPWKLDRFDAATGCSFVRNEDWWGGTTPLDGTEFTFFDDLGPQLTAMQGGAVDALVQFSVIGGDALLNSPDFNVLEIQTATHRQIWMRVDEGQFVDKRVRQAFALTFDREQMLQTLFRGRANIGNDHVIAPFFPYFDPSVPQRVQDIDKAKQLLADAGAEGLHATLQIVNLQEIPELAQLISAGAAQAGITIDIAQESTSTFYGSQWCPAEPADPPCSGAAELGIVDYGHRPTPDIYLQRGAEDRGDMELLPVRQSGLRCRVRRVPAFADRRHAESGVQEDRDDPQRGRPGRVAVLLQLPVGSFDSVQGRPRDRARADVPRPGIAGLTLHCVPRPRRPRVAAPSLALGRSHLSTGMRCPLTSAERAVET